jgi:hypothetical protein
MVKLAMLQDSEAEAAPIAQSPGYLVVLADFDHCYTQRLQQRLQQQKQKQNRDRKAR